MYRLLEYTRFGSYEFIMEGNEKGIETYVAEIAMELHVTLTRNDGRFVEFGEWWYDLGGEGVYVVELA